ncbi:type VI secretion system baseplate subunit TssF [Burkholderia multivorans]|uniref:type VI secretion system baseplate subunit TssF n=1 Tax=Burkholderia multivorans TaxID=87883 RepID=UPI0024B72568|nr:type VI secretion system baseplate subunit TssF [Burkholderia multivorans]
MDDPHISRLLQTFAFMASALDTRLTTDYPEFIESLLGVVYPQYLRCLPSCAIAEIDPAGQFGNLTGTVCHSHAVRHWTHERRSADSRRFTTSL